LIRHLVQGNSARFSTGKFGISFTISKPAPIYVSAEGPKGLQLAGRSADGVILGTGFDLRVFDWAKTQIRAGTTAAGRATNDVAILAAGMLCVRDDGTEARRIVRNRIANRAHHNFRFTLETVPPEELDGVKRFMDGFDVMKPMEDRVDPNLVNDYLVRRFSVAGTPTECIERIEELKAAGVQHLMLTPARKVYHETVDAFANKVIPHFAK
jgi:5,10-methylenetetrahydromethanopterin reductase